jgi:hypothetical protein
MRGVANTPFPPFDTPLGAASATRRATHIRPLCDLPRATTNSNYGGGVLESNTFDVLTARFAWKALRFWEAREALRLIVAASLWASAVAMIWLPWITGKPTMTVLAMFTLLAEAVRALLRRQGPRPAV